MTSKIRRASSSEWRASASSSSDRSDPRREVRPRQLERLREMLVP